MVSNLQVRMTFEVSSLIHSTGDRLALWIDKPTALDSNSGERPILTASSVKGLLRTTAESLLRSQGKTVCIGPRPEQLCADPMTSCLVCRHFGSPRVKSPLRFFEAWLDGDVRRDTRMSVGIERRRRVAKEDHLFSLEVSQARTLIAEVSGLYSQQESAKEAIGVLYLAAKAVFALGGGRSRGLGHVDLSRYDAQLDGTEQSIDEVLGIVLEILG
jgi:CRISPR/Cas system CSM-associated protein Csm3 (group 7 of RAMP superfamily)